MPPNSSHVVDSADVAAVIEVDLVALTGEQRPSTASRAGAPRPDGRGGFPPRTLAFMALHLDPAAGAPARSGGLPLLIAAAACSVAPDESHQVGTLSNGSFQYQCIMNQDPFCPMGSVLGPRPFPTGIAVGGRFSLSYTPTDANSGLPRPHGASRLERLLRDGRAELRRAQAWHAMVLRAADEWSGDRHHARHRHPDRQHRRERHLRALDDEQRRRTLIRGRRRTPSARRSPERCSTHGRRRTRACWRSNRASPRR